MDAVHEGKTVGEIMKKSPRHVVAAFEAILIEIGEDKAGALKTLTHPFDELTEYLLEHMLDDGVADRIRKIVWAAVNCDGCEEGFKNLHGTTCLRCDSCHCWRESKGKGCDFCHDSGD